MGRYLLLDRVAIGGMAEIFRAKSVGIQGFERIIAIKKILPSLAGDDEFVSMFVSEAKIAGQLNHANIAPIYELGKIDESHFIAMEYVFGKDLLQIRKRLRKLGQTVPVPMAAWITAKMLEALDYAHRKRGPDGQPLRIIHRDVSPQNVLVSYEGLVKLIDFGIAKAASRASQTQAGVIKGKLSYMSPEQIMGRTLDHRSDIFAASVCFHEMLTGQRLFLGAHDIATIENVRAAQAAPPSTLVPGLPPELDAIVMKGLAREVGDRYRTAGEMQEELMGFIMKTRPPFGSTKLKEWMRSTFAAEFAEEGAHLQQLSDVAAAGQSVAGVDPVPASDGEFEELSQLVYVEELSAHLAALDPSPGPSPAAVVMAPAPAAMPLPAAAPHAAYGYPQEEILTPPPPEEMPDFGLEYAPDPAFGGPVSGGPVSSGPVSRSVVEPAPAPLERGAAMSGRMPEISGPMPRVSAPPMGTGVVGHAQPSVNTPSVAPGAFPPEQAPAKRRRWPLFLGLFVLLLLMAGGGFAAWVFAFGGRAVLGI